MKVVYIAGPFRGANSWEIEQNIRRAEELALEVWKAGAVAVCPHTNTRFFQGTLSDNIWLKGYLELVDRCDALIYVTEGAKSEGTREEIKRAKAGGIPVFHALANGKLTAAFYHWLKTGTPY